MGSRPVDMPRLAAAARLARAAEIASAMASRSPTSSPVNDEEPFDCA